MGNTGGHLAGASSGTIAGSMDCRCGRCFICACRASPAIVIQAWFEKQVLSNKKAAACYTSNSSYVIHYHSRTWSVCYEKKLSRRAHTYLAGNQSAHKAKPCNWSWLRVLQRPIHE